MGVGCLEYWWERDGVAIRGGIITSYMAAVNGVAAHLSRCFDVVPSADYLA